ncbi:MAG: hypothetical protein PHO41_06980 [Eubacteriales bacterium]|nr:hypothetical protein [Eubacteriales bacterium]
MTVVWIIAGVLALTVFAVSWKLSGMVVWPKTWDYDECYEEEIRRGGFDRTVFETEYHAEEFFTPSPFSYIIHGMVIPKKEGVCFPDGRERVAVIAHGYSYTLLGGIKYAAIFRELGYEFYQRLLYQYKEDGRYSGANLYLHYRRNRWQEEQQAFYFHV